MVNTIDATRRRRDLAEAVWRLVARGGVAGASVRAVAAESGLSTGSVRHFFGAQHELIEFAMRELISTVGERIAAATTVSDPAQRAMAMLSQVVPLQDATHVEALAHLQFVTQARFDPRLAEISAESFDGIRRTCHAAALAVGPRLSEEALAAEAERLSVVVDGLTLQLLTAPGHLDRGRARALLAAQLSTVGVSGGPR